MNNSIEKSGVTIELKDMRWNGAGHQSECVCVFVCVCVIKKERERGSERERERDSKIPNRFCLLKTQSHHTSKRRCNYGDRNMPWSIT